MEVHACIHRQGIAASGCPLYMRQSEFGCDGKAAGVHSSAFIRFTVSPAASLTSGTHRNIYVCV